MCMYTHTYIYMHIHIHIRKKWAMIKLRHVFTAHEQQ